MREPLRVNSDGTAFNQQSFSCLHSVTAALAAHLIRRQGFEYALTSKSTSDPIEGRFGCYCQVNRGNFYIHQMFPLEKKFAVRVHFCKEQCALDKDE